jgi:hypothetical protein
MTPGFLNVVIPAKVHHRRSRGKRTIVIPRKRTIVIPAAFSPRESGEGIKCLLDQRRWVPGFAGTTNHLVHG